MANPSTAQRSTGGWTPVQVTLGGLHSPRGCASGELRLRLAHVPFFPLLPVVLLAALALVGPPPRAEYPTSDLLPQASALGVEPRLPVPGRARPQSWIRHFPCGARRLDVRADAPLARRDGSVSFHPADRIAPAAGAVKPWRERLVRGIRESYPQQPLVDGYRRMYPAYCWGACPLSPDPQRVVMAELHALGLDLGLTAEEIAALPTHPVEALLRQLPVLLEPP